MTYDSWNEFKSKITNDLCGQLFFGEKQYLFRGQGSHEWSLLTSFDRMFGNLEFGNRKAIEKSLVQEFRNRCRDFLGSDKFSEYSDIQILSLGQHYGLPTRLLDWSYSVYVAAFFAFIQSRNADSDYISIWAIDTENEIWKEDYGVKIVTTRLNENEHQKYQEGIFTFNQSPHIGIEGFVQACSSRCDIDGALTQIIIPHAEQNIALNDLDMMGINHMRLFPGLQGCAETALLKEFIKYKLS